MARINDIRLYGIVADNPTIQKDNKTGEFLKGFCTIIIIGRQKTDQKPALYNYPRILTRNPEQIAEMAKWEKNDVIEIKGSLTTKNMTKVKVCEQCGQKIKRPGTVVYVHPIFSEIRKSKLSQKQAIEEINNNVEISNSAVLMGVLCTDPQIYENKTSHKKLAAYQLAVKRRFRIAEDPAETDVDFPWVKSYNEQGISDAKTLYKGSVVLIDGKLQVREREVKDICPHCQHENMWKDYSMEVVPHAVEYMRNFNSPEKILEKEKAHLQNLKSEIFSSEKELLFPATKPDDYVELEKTEEEKTVDLLIQKVFES